MARNYLLPEGLAKLADESILAAIKAKREAEEAAARKVLDEAKALATALATIGKFTIKVKVGEDKRIFGRHDRRLRAARQRPAPRVWLTLQRLTRRGLQRV